MSCVPIFLTFIKRAFYYGSVELQETVWREDVELVTWHRNDAQCLGTEVNREQTGLEHGRKKKINKPVT